MAIIFLIPTSWIFLKKYKNFIKAEGEKPNRNLGLGFFIYLLSFFTFWNEKFQNSFQILLVYLNTNAFSTNNVTLWPHGTWIYKVGYICGFSIHSNFCVLKSLVLNPCLVELPLSPGTHLSFSSFSLFFFFLSFCCCCCCSFTYQLVWLSHPSFLPSLPPPSWFFRFFVSLRTKRQRTDNRLSFGFRKVEQGTENERNKIEWNENQTWKVFPPLLFFRMIVRRLTTSLFLGTIYVLILCVDKVAMSKNGRKLSRSHFEFSIDLYRQLSEDFSDKNLVFSPYSVNSLLSMLFLGTSSFSNSSRQLRQALHFDNISYVDVHKSFKEIVKNFDDTYYKSKLQMANGVFYQVLDPFKWSTFSVSLLSNR